MIKDLQEPHKTKAYNYTREEYGMVDGKRNLLSAFKWDETEEGEYYWQKVYDGVI